MILLVLVMNWVDKMSTNTLVQYYWNSTSTVTATIDATSWTGIGHIYYFPAIKRTIKRKCMRCGKLIDNEEDEYWHLFKHSGKHYYLCKECFNKTLRKLVILEEL